MSELLCRWSVCVRPFYRTQDSECLGFFASCLHMLWCSVTSLCQCSPHLTPPHQWCQRTVRHCPSVRCQVTCQGIRAVSSICCKQRAVFHQTSTNSLTQTENLRRRWDYHPTEAASCPGVTHPSRPQIVFVTVIWQFDEFYLATSTTGFLFSSGLGPD